MEILIKKIFIVFFVLLFTIFVAFFSIGLYKVYYLEGKWDRSTDNFTKGKMVKLDHGAEALDFFRKSSYDSNYSDCKFYYLDNRIKDSFFHKYCSSFILDLKYETESYNDMKNRLTGIGGEEKDDIRPYQLIYNECKTDDSIVAVFVNDEEQVIRFVFLYGDIVGETDFSSLLLWNTDCGW